MINFLKKRRNLSLSDKRFYYERLEKILINPSILDLDKAFLLTYTEATENNLSDILEYVSKGNYCKLARIKSRLPYFVDAFGEVLNTDIFHIYLLIDKKQQYYLAIVYVPIVSNNVVELKAIIKVNYFFHQIFLNKRLIYSSTF